MAGIQDTGDVKATYVVRGTPIRCSCGSAPDVLNLPSSHGVTVKEQPLLNITDCTVGKNIISFGSCNNPNNPGAKEEITTTSWFFFTSTTEIDKAANGMLPCQPVFEPGTRWMQDKEDVLVGGEPVLTEKATLVCKWGGIILMDKKG
ncbi:DUF4280 domain-containing protein [Paenibacillus tyrfis]|uniref:DUF4280 domain-containing protein n=1 Tax=Paenibacillus tyrfis TaxID=1501230 RepID=UPI00068A18A6|nr:DUF4280 domain-containing protein [Paenibacillus tyrfis]